MSDTLNELDALLDNSVYKSVGRSNIEILDTMATTIVSSINCAYALKGGYALTNILENPRKTTDIDFSIAYIEDYEKLKVILTEIGESFKRSGLIGSYVIKDEVTPTSSGGAKYYKNADNTDMLVGVDIGLHDLLLGVHNVQMRVGEVNAFTVERMLADKISSLLSRKRFRRVKDIYDLYCLVTAFDLDFQMTQQLLDSRVESDLWNNFPYTSEVLCEMERAYDKFKIVNAFTEVDMLKPPFRDVYKVFYTFVNPFKYKIAYCKWNHRTCGWEA